MNQGTDIFDVEFVCRRPGGKRKVISDEAIDRSILSGTALVLPSHKVEKRVDKEGNEREFTVWAPQFCVGIDWGLASQMVAALICRCDDYCALLSTAFFTGQLTDAVIQVMNEWVQEFSIANLMVHADMSHPYNNLDLAKHGFNIVPANFKVIKALGYQNVQRGFSHEKIKIVSDGPGSLGHGHHLMVEQLKKLKRDARGKIKKVDDHGPDALMCGMLSFSIIDEFPDVRLVDEQQEDESDYAEGGVVVF